MDSCYRYTDMQSAQVTLKQNFGLAIMELSAIETVLLYSFADCQESIFLQYTSIKLKLLHNFWAQQYLMSVALASI